MDSKQPTTMVKEEPNEKNTKLERKPSIRKKQAPPLVRQTLTSTRRILKALNPLSQSAALKSGSASSKQATSTGSKPTQSSSTKSAAFCSDSNQLKGTASRRTQSVKETRPNQPQLSCNFKRPQSVLIQKKPGADFDKKATDPVPKPGIEWRRQQWKRPLPTISKPKLEPKRKQQLKVEPKTLKRPPMLNLNRKKSLSSDHIQVKSNKSRINQFQSSENLHVPTPKELNGLSPIDKEGARNCLVFKTPSAYKRRSLYYHYTPSSNRKFNNFIIASTPAPAEMLRLQDRLNQWLRTRGKPPATFHNLNKIIESTNTHCIPTMAIHKIEEQFEDENKENVEVVDDKSDSYEDLKIPTIPEEDIAHIAKEAIVDLIRLVEEGYPTSQCLELLDLIKEKHGKIVDEPEYWELRASVDEADGNFANAVQHFKTAIIQGAKIESVDKSLDLLLQKFSLLNISPSKLEKKTNEEVQKRDKVVLDARNIFKSSIIQIAIRERNSKKSQDTEVPQKKFIATPVRRSTRLSISGFKNSPGLTLCRTLKQADNSTDISFTMNKALI